MQWRSWQKLLLLACSYIPLSCVSPAFSQKAFVKKYEWGPSEGHSLKDDLGDLKCTALAIVPRVDPGTSAISATINGLKVLIPRDEDAPRPTYFLSLPEATSAIEIDHSEAIDFYAIHSGRAPVVERRQAGETDCLTLPSAVTQEIWRDGLQAPNFNRTANNVTHHIVHHTAGSNSNANYTQVVRDIYLFHTQVNGWSDIGYNFLIAQDGTIYEGRDPGQNLTEFEVVGAHFCAKNSGTLGISLLGNYETAAPTDPALESLRDLLAYSFEQLEIDPTASSTHRGQTLEHLSGHRDGCSTLCPGANLYSLLSSMRVEVQTTIDNCEPPISAPSLSFSGPSQVTARATVTFVNTSTGYENYQWVFEEGSPSTSSTESVDVYYQHVGIYDITLIGEALDGSLDTLYARDYVRVGSQVATPWIYPNAVATGGQLNIEFGEPIVVVTLMSMTGQEIATYLGVDGVINLPPTRSGVHILKVRTQAATYFKRLIIQ